LQEAAGAYWSELALGVVFAAKARTFAGYVPAHTEVAADVIVGLTGEDAARIADQSEVVPPSPGVSEGPVPQYEVWRQRIRDCLSKL
jgi:hypothetical protein